MEQIISQLKEKGVVFKAGLNQEQIEVLDSALSGTLPLELKRFLSYGVPVDSLDQSALAFPDWHNDAKSILKRSQGIVDQLFESDIEDGYWNDLFGEKPVVSAEAKSLALQFIHRLPTLIPIYGHRFMIAVPSGSPVISFHGPFDTIVYGDSLEDYLIKEFDLDLGIRDYDNHTEMGGWEKILQDV